VSHTIFGGPSRSDTRFLDELAAATGGQVWKVEDLDVEQAFLKALGEFRNRYTIQYAAGGSDSEEWHEIDVRVRVSGVDVRVREGYLRRPSQP
jgi:hypothetical protein